MSNFVSIHDGGDLVGAREDVARALTIREDFLLEACGKGRLFEVRHYLPSCATWWIRNRAKLWEHYDGEEFQLAIRAKMENKRQRRIANAQKREANEDNKKRTRTPRRKQNPLRSVG